MCSLTKRRHSICCNELRTGRRKGQEVKDVKHDLKETMSLQLIGRSLKIIKHKQHIIRLQLEMGCGSSSQAFHPVVVEHDRPSDSEQLKSCLKKALGDKKMVILELGDRDNDWIKDARCDDEIVMVDCKALYEEQKKKSKSEAYLPKICLTRAILKIDYLSCKRELGIPHLYR
ncbi:unnamed protein product [Mytilus coruscus]|uniref:Uncharacterized protein n=1 Tax=Mytilus coruscus TaxID=42192 RepID=A0A6J7ZYJ8_MYTCO|nr:unnamed protein product [Mytilus coruscus]